MKQPIRRSTGLRSMRVLTLAAIAAVGSQPLWAQVAAAPRAAGHISDLLNEKQARTDAQQKLGSQLWYALQSSRGQRLTGIGNVYDNAVAAVKTDDIGRVKVRISATVSDSLLKQIAAAGGVVHYAALDSHAILATMPLNTVESIAANPDVQRIAPAARARTNVGAVTSQGYISHKANLVVAGGHDGTNVRVGVLSDSSESLQALIASGDLPPLTTVVPGQAGTGESEGTAMMEIVHDLAPGATLFFASAFNGEDSFADNIRMLRNVYKCDIIVDDVSYSDEGVFQDTTVALAVNDVTASGALYFSAAANSGNLTSGTSGTWEGDFTPGAASAAPLPTGYTLHDFGGGQTYNVLTGSTNDIVINWSDPFGASSNDYDLFILNSTGTTVLCANTDIQAGSGNPQEECYAGDGKTYPANSRIVIAKKAGAAVRALHVDTERGTLSIATAGATLGHNAGRNTVSMAATFWNSAKTGTKAFVGGKANPTETFSSDGPRKIFFNPDGSSITPGNVLFATNGGATLAKPDQTKADGMCTNTPGFLPFYGTSAAAPLAAAIAALVKSARPDYTNVQILNAMKQTALDIRAAGIDRDSGAGIAMAQEAVNYALTH